MSAVVVVGAMVAGGGVAAAGAPGGTAAPVRSVSRYAEDVVFDARRDCSGSVGGGIVDYDGTFTVTTPEQAVAGQRSVVRAQHGEPTTHTPVRTADRIVYRFDDSSGTPVGDAVLVRAAPGAWRIDTMSTCTPDVAGS